MSHNLEKAGSLLNIICHSKRKDCVNFFDHLDDKGIELVCKLLYFIVSGDLEVNPATHSKLKKKLKKHVKEIKKLFLIPRNSKDIVKKKKILQKLGIISSLTAIATAINPTLKKIIVEKNNKNE